METNGSGAAAARFAQQVNRLAARVNGTSVMIEWQGLSREELIAALTERANQSDPVDPTDGGPADYRERQITRYVDAMMSLRELQSATVLELMTKEEQEAITTLLIFAGVAMSMVVTFEPGEDGSLMRDLMALTGILQRMNGSLAILQQGRA